jgi:hypothetical protein
MLVRDKHFSLLDLYVSFEEIGVCEYDHNILAAKARSLDHFRLYQSPDGSSASRGIS